MSKHYDVLVKKSVHFNLTKDSHTALKVACAARGLSMQEVVEAFAKRIEVEDNKMMRFLDDCVEAKKHKSTSSGNKFSLMPLWGCPTKLLTPCYYLGLRRARARDFYLR